MPDGNKNSYLLKQTCNFSRRFVSVDITFYYHQVEVLKYEYIYIYINGMYKKNYFRLSLLVSSSNSFLFSFRLFISFIILAFLPSLSTSLFETSTPYSMTSLIVSSNWPISARWLRILKRKIMSKYDVSLQFDNFFKV